MSCLINLPPKKLTASASSAIEHPPFFALSSSLSLLRSLFFAIPPVDLLFSIRLGAIPICGTAGAWLDLCRFDGGMCKEITIQKVQVCR